MYKILDHGQQSQTKTKGTFRHDSYGAKLIWKLEKIYAEIAALPDGQFSCLVADACQRWVHSRLVGYRPLHDVECFWVWLVRKDMARINRLHGAKVQHVLAWSSIHQRHSLSVWQLFLLRAPQTVHAPCNNGLWMPSTEVLAEGNLRNVPFLELQEHNPQVAGQPTPRFHIPYLKNQVSPFRWVEYLQIKDR